jgi:hypothetical protein
MPSAPGDVLPDPVVAFLASASMIVVFRLSRVVRKLIIT